jgi:hypothetical protein
MNFTVTPVFWGAGSSLKSFSQEHGWHLCVLAKAKNYKQRVTAHCCLTCDMTSPSPGTARWIQLERGRRRVGRGRDERPLAAVPKKTSAASAWLQSACAHPTLSASPFPEGLIAGILCKWYILSNSLVTYQAIKKKIMKWSEFSH